MLLAIVRSATVTRLPSLALGAGLGALLMFAPAAANAHDVTVDGASSEWSTLSTAYANLGFIARTEALTGEYIFWDVTYDQWTETTQEYDLDLEKIQVTGNSGSLFFLLSVDGTDPGVAQYQISIDLDCISGSGQNALAGSAETTVNAAAEWEYLVQTTFHDSGSTGARVLDTSFNVVAGAVLAEATAGIVEIGVPWTQLGLTGPPSTPIRITVSSYRSSANSPTVYDVAGAAQSNVFDAMSDCGDPRWRYYPSNFNCEVSDKDIDFFTELTFEADGDVIAPILLDRMVLNSSLTTGSAGLWVAIRNVTSSTIQLGNFKLGNEKVVDPRFGSGELATFPAGATLAPGATYIVGVEGTMYQTRYGELPDAEFESTSAAPNMTTYAPWFSDLVASGYSLNDGVGEVLVVDPSNTILDVLPYGLGTFPGVTPLTSSGPDETVVFRTVPNVDTDNCNLDFSMSTKPACADTASCAEICMTCNLNTCTPVAVGTSCPDSLSCNGLETCNAAGTCAAGTPVDCSDGHSCTDDVCDEVTGCSNPPSALDTVCRASAGACDSAELCDGLGNPCPVDTKHSTQCRASQGTCDLAETCDGVGDDCPADLKSNGVCRVAADGCDVVETCDGINDGCPADAFKSDGASCTGGLCGAGICIAQAADAGADGGVDAAADAAADSGGVTERSDAGSSASGAGGMTHNGGTGGSTASGGAGGGSGGDGATAGAGGANTNPSEVAGAAGSLDVGSGGTEEPEGCACTLPGKAHSGSSALWTMLALTAMACSRRRSS